MHPNGRLNISKEEYEAKEFKLNLLLIIFIAMMGIVFAIFGVRNDQDYSINVVILLYTCIGLFFGGVLTMFTFANLPKRTPFCVYQYFEERQERVLSSENIGSEKSNGVHGYFEGTNLFQVKTNKCSYVVEINYKEEKTDVVSCYEKK